MSRHPTQSLLDPFTREHVDIDCGMVAIIQMLWEHGVQTETCCEGDQQHQAYVMLPARQRDVAARLLANATQFAEVDAHGEPTWHAEHGWVIFNWDAGTSPLPP